MGRGTALGYLLIAASACAPTAPLLPTTDVPRGDDGSDAVVDVIADDHVAPVADIVAPDLPPTADAGIPLDVATGPDAVAVDAPPVADAPALVDAPPVVDVPTPVDVAPPDVPARPSTCALVRRANPAAPDGEYTLYVAGDGDRPWRAWCHRMSATPTEYLPLASTSPTANASQYTAGGYRPGTSVRTTYQRVRIDPVTLAVNIGDQTFATSRGRITITAGAITSMPFSVAADCVDGFVRSGVANVDLRGTPFAVAPDAFVTLGNSAGGAATYGARNQTVDLLAGGACGWIAPRAAPYDPINAAGGFDLPLVYLGP